MAFNPGQIADIKRLAAAGLTPAQIESQFQAAGIDADQTRISAAMGGGAGTSGADLASLFRQPDVTLPRGEEAKGQLRDLQLEGVGGLRSLMNADPNARRATMEAAFYDPMAEQIDYDADRAIREGNEVYAGRGVLNSTIPVDYMRAPLERERMQAKGRARNNAITSAGSELRADTATNLQTLGQAFNQGTSGLQADANVEMANANRNAGTTQAGYQTGIQVGENAANRGQQEGQFTRSLGQQEGQFTRSLGEREGQFTRSLGQQERLQDKAFANTEKIAGENRIAAGIGGGLAGLAGIFGPSLDRSLKGWGF